MTNQIQGLSFLFPEAILVFFAIGCCLWGVFTNRSALIGTYALLGVAMSALSLPASFGAGKNLFFGMLTNDPFSAFFRQVILIVAGLAIMISLDYKDLDRADLGEYYFFLLTIAVSLMLAASANNLLMIYISLESISLVSYIMAGYSKRDIFSSEAGMKYFLFGAVSTGMTLYGISLIYGLLGTLSLPAIVGQCSTIMSEPAAGLALLLILVGFGFKCSLVPFHMWTPDVYQGAPTPMAALFSVGSKTVGFAFLLRVFVLTFGKNFESWPLLASMLAIVTMTLGNLTALEQTNLKRLLAYSTIAQAGYIFLGLAIATPMGIKAFLFYLFVYALMNMGAFGAVIIINNSLKSEQLEDYSGFYRRDPLTAVTFAILLLSLAGLPPLAGFLAKFFIIAAAVEAKLTVLAGIVVINSVVAVYYYVRIIKFMFLHEPSGQAAPPGPCRLHLHLVLVITAAANLILGLWPHAILGWITNLLRMG